MMRRRFSFLFGKASTKPVVTDADNKLIPMPKGFVGGYIRTMDDGRLVVEQEGKLPLVWNATHSKWYELHEKVECDCRTCGNTHNGTCPMKLPGCPLNEENAHG